MIPGWRATVEKERDGIEVYRLQQGAGKKIQRLAYGSGGTERQGGLQKGLVAFGNLADPD